ncbi:macrophage mannose receptor 1-like [Glandiceps talaboti]
MTVDMKCAIALLAVVLAISEAAEDKYILYDETLTANEAAIACHSRGMKLAVDGSPLIHQYLIDYIKSEGLGGQDFYINARRFGAEYRTFDGKLLEYTAWSSGEPSGNGDCIYMRHGTEFRWDDASCGDRRRYICEPGDEAVNELMSNYHLFNDQKIPSDALNACEIAGLEFAKDLNEQIHGALVYKIILAGKSGRDFNINAKEYDGSVRSYDGQDLEYQPWASGQPDLSNGCIYLWSSRDYLWDDTGCDSKRDYICEGQASLSQEEKDKYVLYDETLTGDEAAIACHSRGMKLAVDGSPLIHQYLIDYIKSEGLGGQDFYVNARRFGAEYRTFDGKLLEYTAWSNGEPSGNGDCIYMRHGTDFRWDDASCGDRRRYICEPGDEEVNKLMSNYHLFTDQKIPSDALNACEIAGLEFAKDLNEQIHGALVYKIILAGKSGRDFNINAKQYDGSVRSYDGQDLEYQPWASGQPDHSNGCIYLCLDVVGQYAAFPCSHHAFLYF